MLKKTERNKGIRLKGRTSFGSTKIEPPRNDIPTLADLGLDKKTSFWQYQNRTARKYFYR